MQLCLLLNELFIVIEPSELVISYPLGSSLFNNHGMVTYFLNFLMPKPARIAVAPIKPNAHAPVAVSGKRSPCFFCCFGA